MSNQPTNTFKNSIKQDDTGIGKILYAISKPSLMNQRIDGLIEWIEREYRKEWSSSMLYYLPSDKFLRFISLTEYNKMKILLWDNYTPSDETVLIRDINGRFFYTSTEPIKTIISKSAWIFQANDTMKKQFYRYIHESAELERLIWQAKLNNSRKVETFSLF